MIHGKHTLLALLLVLCLSATALAQEPEQQYDERQLTLMEARILSRQGRLPESLALYEKLRRAYPGDDEIWLDYVETLTANDLQEQAIIELAKFRKKFGATPRLERMEAALYGELQQPQRSQELLEKTLRGNPQDAGLWSQLAFLRQAANDAGGAIQTFSAVLEIDPENQAAREALHSLLKENRPKFETQYTFLDQGKNAATQTQSAAYSRYLTDSTRLFLHYDQVNIFRKGDGTDTTRISQDVSIAELRLDQRLARNWYLELGAKAFKGMGDGLAPMLGSRYDFGALGKVRAAYSYQEPYYDIADAADLHGSKNHLVLEYDLTYRENWVFYANYEYDTYSLSQHEVGYRWSTTSSISRRLWSRPDVFLTYTFNWAELEYRNGITPPFDFIRREQGHAGTLTVTQPVTRWLDISLSGGIKHDYSRKAESTNFSSKLVFKPAERLNIEAGYEFVSESASSAGGGENNTYTFRLAWIW